jgi:hypothetical protein
MWITVSLIKLGFEFRQYILILLNSLSINNLCKALFKLLPPFYSRK